MCAPLHRRPDLPGAAGGAPQAFRLSPSDGHRGAGRGDDRACCTRRGCLPRPPMCSALPRRKEELLALEGFGEKKVANLIAAIEARRRVPLERFIFALGIRRIGEQNAKLLARHYGSFENWRRKMIAARVAGSEAREELGAIQGIGPAIAEELVEFFAEPRNLAALEDLVARGPAAARFRPGGRQPDRRQDDRLHRHPLGDDAAGSRSAGRGLLGAKRNEIRLAQDGFRGGGADAGSKAAKAAGTRRADAERGGVAGDRPRLTAAQPCHPCPALPCPPRPWQAATSCPVDPQLLAAYLLAVVVLILTPGPDMLFALGQTLAGGHAAAGRPQVGASCSARRCMWRRRRPGCRRRSPPAPPCSRRCAWRGQAICCGSARRPSAAACAAGVMIRPAEPRAGLGAAFRQGLLTDLSDEPRGRAVLPGLSAAVRGSRPRAGVAADAAARAAAAGSRRCPALLGHHRRRRPAGGGAAPRPRWPLAGGLAGLLFLGLALRLLLDGGR